MNEKLRILQQEERLAAMEQSLNAYHSFFDFSAEAIFIHRNGLVLDVNQTVTDLFGYTKEELFNRNVIDIIPLEKYIPIIKEHLSHEYSSVYTIEGRDKSGRIIPLELRGKTIPSSRGDIRITSVRDISQQVKVERSLHKTHKELIESKGEVMAQERKFEALFNISFNAYIIHQNGRILEVNDMFTKLFGYSNEEAKNLNVFDDLFPNEVMVKEYLTNVSRSRRTYFVGQQKRKDGSTFEAEIIASYEVLNGEEVRLVTIKDISQLVASERSLKEKNEELMNRNRELELISEEMVSSRNTFYQSLHDNQAHLSQQDLQQVTIFGRWNYDVQNNHFTWMDEVNDIIGLEHGSPEASIDYFISHVHPDDREELKRQFFDALKKRKLFKSEFRFITESKKEKYVLVQGIANYNEDDEVDALVGTMLDITDRKEIENHLKRQKDHFLQLNEELIISRKKAEDSEKLKTSFFSNMSHEIRTPMNGILGFSSLLMEPELTDEERIEYTKVIVDSGKRLLHIVNDVLDISKLESDNFKIVTGETKVNQLLDNLYRLFSQNPKILEGKINFSLSKSLCDEEAIMMTDQNRLSQILTNLLSNALKFTEEGEIRFGYRLAGDALNFFVEDTGIGVPADMQDKIFEPFRQVEGHLVRQHGGTGLGLSISRKLTALLGGELLLESEENKGSKFEFTLPYQKPHVHAVPCEDNESQVDLKDDIKDVCLLIAEDDEVNFLFYKSFLGRHMKLKRACNGQEAVNMVQADSAIDIVLMDVKMPVMDGYEAMKQIKKIRPQLPVIAQTAYAMPEDKKRAAESGADDYVSKPINRRQLLEKIKRFCTKK